jgi:capsid protein
MNALDRLIGYLSPATAARRAFERVRLEGLRQATAVYEGASRSSRTAWKRVGAGGSANVELGRSLWRLRDVSRDLVRNNPYAANIVGAIPANVVGAGIIPSVVVTAGKRVKQRLQGLVAEHLDTPAIDFDGRHNLYGLQNLAMRTIVEAGEVLVVRYVAPPALRLAVPLQVRVLEPDYLDAMKNGPVAGG